MTAILRKPAPQHTPKPWSLEELGYLVKDFLEYARQGLEWEDVDEAPAGRINYRRIGEYVSHMAGSDKYRPFIDLNYSELIDGDKEEAVVLAYFDKNGAEIGRLKIKRA